MKGKKLLATIAISAVLFSGCGLKSMQAVMKINDEVITQGQFDKLFDKQIDNFGFDKMGVDLKQNKSGLMYLMLKDRVINELIVKTLLEEEMTKRGIKVTNADVDNAVEEIINKVGSKEQLNLMLQRNGISSSRFKNELKEEVKMKKLALQLGDSSVSEAEAKKYYNDNIAKFKYPDKVRASHILIAVNPAEIEEVIRADKANKDLTEEQIKAKVNDEIAAKEAKAKEVLAKVQKDPANFAQIAKENSEDTTTAVKGGELGFFAAQEMVPEFSKAAFAMKPNTVSGLVKTQFGYHIIKVTDRMAAGQEPYEKVKNDIKAYLQNQRELQAIDNLVESLKKSANIEYVNPEYDPKEIQKAVQTEIKNAPQTEARLKKEAEERKAKEQKK